LRVELAQYRELAAFTQFGSDLSKDTLERLRHGERIVETLKQPQYEPMPVEQQVLILYALTNRYFTNVKVESIQSVQREYLTFISERHGYIIEEIQKTHDISAELGEKIKSVCTEFFKKFN
jgi:F-type H+-transporting ATPase subunit alpha